MDNVNIKWTIVNSEDLVQSSLVDCERMLTNFLALLGFKTSASKLRNIIQYDSHQFINESVWWDQSEIADNILSMSVPSRSPASIYSNDFYFLYGNQSFLQYLSDNRQCYNQGTFPQLQSETLSNRFSSDKPERCSLKPFDCAFDTQTLKAYRKFYSKKKPSTSYDVKWDLIDLGANASPFLASAKSTETLKIVGPRMFPMAKWIIWLDGKAHLQNISDILLRAQSPMIIPSHHDTKRTSASEVGPTIRRLKSRGKSSAQQLKISIAEILLQQAEYRHDGFYARSDTLGLKMVDIAILVYKNNHPCVIRYVCGWHNEINYFSYRGQLSVYYPGVRLNLTHLVRPLPKKFYYTKSHKAVC
ncbi:unnamed protein product [Rotaria socialis]|uniref:TOD1/MUCI70 glycosyltransferase-like domain-containing protein n=1 Tax=Rotaria socialis TaxID=392032 RepID=A0A817U6T5_9BILA|nr:unnamed protein product [Rotaria socialis]CAF3445239.1 unnamed protein product [Rotaria socialis]CAF3584153.1 unnamed protein product [Rotaria socialis]CAF4295125.1 unnamed protein product [Rotaria socialis]CAF4335609.1 unnamed protein product [Rotaria socialis]